MRPAEEVARVRELALEGRNACEIARLTGIPRSTLREWLHPRYTPRYPRESSCEVCGHPVHDYEALPEPEYSYLLGIYLGDGTTCAPQACDAAPFSCCLPNRTCVMTDAADCAAQGGTFGATRSCQPNPC